jgi:hypothetical protein
LPEQAANLISHSAEQQRLVHGPELDMSQLLIPDFAEDR